MLSHASNTSTEVSQKTNSGPPFTSSQLLIDEHSNTDPCEVSPIAGVPSSQTQNTAPPNLSQPETFSFKQNQATKTWKRLAHDKCSKPTPSTVTFYKREGLGIVFED